MAEKVIDKVHGKYAVYEIVKKLGCFQMITTLEKMVITGNLQVILKMLMKK